MRPLLDRIMIGYAVYWAPAKVNSFGERSFDSPIEIRCRWESDFAEQIGGTGTLLMWKARVYVREDLQVGGYLKEGRLSSVQNLNDPVAENANEIIRFSVFPRLRGKDALKTAYL